MWREGENTLDDRTRNEIDARPLSESEARERRLLETSHEGIVQVDPDTRVVYVNERIAELVGCPREEILGEHLFRFVHPEDHEALKKGRERRTHGQRDSYDLRLLRPDGSVVYTILNASPITDAEGRFAGALGMFTDVTDRRRAEERSAAFQALGLQLNEARTPEAAARVVLDVADRLLGWDCCWLELGNPDGQFGRTTVLMDLVDGRRVDVPSPCGDMFTTPLVQRVLREGPLAIFREPSEVPQHSPDPLPFGDTGRLSGSILCVPIRSQGRPVGAMSIQSYSFHAYTEDDLALLQSLAEYCAGALVRTQAEAAREQLQQQLLHAQKMEAVGRLAGGVAHDFNNMLAVINGYANLLLTRNELADPVRLALREIQRAGERAADLTRQLLAFSRKQLLDPQILDLNRIVLETETMLRRMIGEDVELVVRLDRELGRIKADPTQVEQILVNLAVNARDAMPTGGRLIVETTNVELDALFVRPHAELEPGPYVLLSVADTGCGMTSEVLARIWEPFFTTKGVGEGTGLGLATIYGIVKQSGGHVEVQSEPDRGSTFRVYLPRVASAPANPDSSDLSTPLPGSETVLVVEDEAMVRDLVRTVLELSGYTVLEAGDGQEALEIARCYSGTIDVLLTDVVMPGGSGGGAVAERLAALRPGIKVLFMSGYTEDAVVRRGIRHEGTAFIHKPFTHAELTRKLRELLGSD